jgi:hypothetical protein
LAVVGLVFEFVETVDFDEKSLRVGLEVGNVLLENGSEFFVLFSGDGLDNKP